MNTATHEAPPRIPTMGDGRLLGILNEVRNDPLRVFTSALREPSEIVRMKFATRSALFLKHPDHIELVLQQRAKTYTKSIRHYESLRLALGNGLVTSDGSFWLRQRRLAQPAFHRARIAAFADTMADATEKLLARWQPNIAAPGTRAAPIDVSEEMMHVTLEIVCRTLLGTDVPEAGDIGRAVGIASRFIDERSDAIVPLPVALPFPANLRFKKAMAALDRAVYAIIAERRAHPRADAGDLLSMLMEARDEDTGETMSDTQLRDEVMTMFVAGHETTACALSWTFFLLSRHPKIEIQLRSDVIAAFGDGPIGLDGLRRVPLLERVVKESMRLYPPVWILGRAAVEPDVLDGVPIAAGDWVLMSPYVTHRHPDIWDNPEGFDPDRFLPEAQKARSRFAWFPFAGGPRQCIGDQFAMMEAQIVLATVLRRVRLTLAPWQVVEPEPLVTLRPKDGLAMFATRVAL